MKIDTEKLNKILANSELKEIFMPIITGLSNDGEYGDKSFLFGFGFYKKEKDDDIDDEEQVLNINLILTLDVDFRNFIMSTFLSGKYSEFFEEFLEDSDIVIPYKKWKKEERKYKLKKLKTIENE